MKNKEEIFLKGITESMVKRYNAILSTIKFLKKLKRKLRVLNKLDLCMDIDFALDELEKSIH